MARRGSQCCLLGVGAPAAQRVHNQRIVHIDEDGDGRVDGGDGFDSENGVEESAAGASKDSGISIPMRPSSKSCGDEIGSELLLVVHAAHERLDLFLGELLHRVVEERFFFGELGERGGSEEFL